ncbi:MAG: hypothetical protein A3H28_04655 [Acidobacteria bacterium RIFCSPLOWO2_02_FULL_61_28]|nr:MAG: hypothetical protein A3H28_04655 [Acidobacteria bacterium RIFCSPLOWO2_02_FULL_61_28]
MATPRASILTLLLHHGLQWFGEVIKTLRRLWLEVTGTVFLALALYAGAGTLREWRAYGQGSSLWRLGSSVFVLVMMLGFGLYSFWKARRIR